MPQREAKEEVIHSALMTVTTVMAVTADRALLLGNRTLSCPEVTLS